MGYFRQPNDGLRAVCPEFVSRCSLGNHHWIVCAGGRPQFETKEQRDQHYRDICCTQGCKGCVHSIAVRPR